MGQALVTFVAGLLGAGLGAVAATRWIPGGRGGPQAPAAAEAASLDDVRDQLRELRTIVDRPRELATPSASTALRAGSTTGPGSDAGALAAGAPSAALAEAIEKAVAAGIDRARKEDPGAFGPPKAEPRKKVSLAEVARELALSSAQEDDIRRAYAEATDKFLKLVAEPESTPDALRRELEEVKSDPGRRAALTMKYIPKVLGKLGDFMAIQADRDAKVHKALGKDNVLKYEKYRVAEEDPFGLDGDGFTVGTTVSGN